jgi:3-oxoacyl-[acyl-carrier protein] reductase
MNILITGASRGLGRALSERYRARGDAVIGLSRSPSDLSPHVRCDVGDPAAVKQTFEALRTETEGFHLDLVINCAALGYLRFAGLMSPVQAQAMVDANVMGTWNVCREAFRDMPRGGRIVNVSSIHALTRPAGSAMYAATKAAVEAMTVCLSREYAFRGVTVNAVALSPYESDMLRASGSEEAIQRSVEALPIARLATVDDVANVVDFFASAASEFVTGQTIRLGGVA